jgi:hypothetical protein
MVLESLGPQLDHSGDKPVSLRQKNMATHGVSRVKVQGEAFFQVGLSFISTIDGHS